MNRAVHMDRLLYAAGAVFLTLLLLLTATACREGGGSVVPTPTDTADEEPTSPPVTDDLPSTEGAGSLTLGASTTPVEPADTESLPTGDDLRENVDYTALIITSFYTTGNVAGDGRVAASYVELYNDSDEPISLAGVALYVSDRGGDFTEYRFGKEDTVPAEGYFLIRGRDANGLHDDALTVEHYDRLFPSLCPDTKDTRLVLAAAERMLPIDKPLAVVDGLFAYVSSSDLDAEDTYHHAGNLSANKVVRKKAATDKTDYQTINLTRASATVLEQIRPQAAAGDVNIAVNTLIDEVVFSHPSGVYTEGFDLTMTAPEGYTIYFTINDTDPRDSMPLIYSSPLHLKDTTEMSWGKLTSTCATYLGGQYDPLSATFPGAAVIKAFAVRENDGAVTPLTTHTYFIGDLYETWGVDMVSLTLDAGDFLGSEGIYNTVMQNVTGQHEHIPAYVEFFSPTGEAVHMGWCEIAMNGKGSLGMTQKSFRVLLKANVMETEDVYENLSTMDYDLFGAYASTTPDGERVTWYRHILLRNGGGDMSGSTISRSHIGDAYIQRIDRYLTPDVMAYAPVMVFVNGEFWGLYNARDRLDTKYFAGKYGVPEEDFVMLECPYPLTYGWNVDYTTAYGDPAEAEAFMALVRFCQNNDMSNADNYNYIASRVDIDGLIDFYCAQIYLCCSDWPSNNIKIWRNTDPTNTGVDIKWHFCIVDTDHGVGLNSSVETNLWGVINDGPVLSRMVNHLLTNPQFRERFLMRYVWCIEVYFAPERLETELDDLVASITPVMQYQLDRWRCTNGERTDWDKWYSYIEVIRDFIYRRPTYAKAQFMSWAGLNEADYKSLREKALAEWGSEVH